MAKQSGNNREMRCAFATLWRSADVSGKKAIGSRRLAETRGVRERELPVGPFYKEGG